MKAFKLGRDHNNDFVIENSSVSANHALISISKDFKSFVLKDNNSTNGTFVNNNEIVSKNIAKDSAIVLGTYHINTSVLFKKLAHFIHENRTDFSQEFAQLKALETQYKKKKNNLKRDYQLKSILLRFAITASVLAGLYFTNLVDLDLLSKIGFILFGVVGAFTFFTPINKKVDHLNDELFVKYVQDFVCPKCRKELAQRSFNYWKAKGNCPSCKCNWTKE